MKLKEEIAKMQEAYGSKEEEERIREIEESIYDIYRQIGVIVEYVDMMNIKGKKGVLEVRNMEEEE